MTDENKYNPRDTSQGIFRVGDRDSIYVMWKNRTGNYDIDDVKYGASDLGQFLLYYTSRIFREALIKELNK